MPLRGPKPGLDVLDRVPEESPVVQAYQKPRGPHQRFKHRFRSRESRNVQEEQLPVTAPTLDRARQQHLDDLRTHIEELRTHIEELRKQNEELRKQNEELRKANPLKKLFCCA
ncbi:hypothetical protein CHLRE_11g467685v5 [Chlamydomonas reinhardtii]|uniref:Uncharacterized protein n=1 Tax=Chlamydomonas reinhardtii TaxID=3055 RepID=A0A2K3D7P4_CHLRE|nr:uncharacterized protein CHLRE_11g467685v5 [Chlamydomonas reinhardtii]PNW76548.1 hypothetical protein CHLRE_11g467685v5 [Chlamydomonas reinhardtii]